MRLDAKLVVSDHLSLVFHEGLSVHDRRVNSCLCCSFRLCDLLHCVVNALVSYPGTAPVGSTNYNSRLRILPADDRGISLTNSTSRTCLYPATCDLTCLWI